MSKISPDIRIPEAPGGMVTAIRDVLRRIATQINLVSEGRVDGAYNAVDAIPTGAGKNGDFVRKRTVTEAGAAGSKYVIIGFVCTASGNPGTWREMRVLTGN